jgi:hypothetical protein
MNTNAAYTLKCIINIKHTGKNTLNNNLQFLLCFHSNSQDLDFKSQKICIVCTRQNTQRFEWYSYQLR